MLNFTIQKQIFFVCNHLNDAITTTLQRRYDTDVDDSNNAKSQSECMNAILSTSSHSSQTWKDEEKYECV